MSVRAARFNRFGANQRLAYQPRMRSRICASLSLNGRTLSGTIGARVSAYGTSGTTPYGVTRSTQVHNTGEIWCSTLWDINWLLINKHGYDPDLYTGYDASGSVAERAGNKLAMQLVMDGMKLQPANPSFAQARDAILAADLALTGGANQAELWQAFARRGMGASFISGTSSSTSVTPGFDLPIADPYVTAVTPSGSFLAPVSSMAPTSRSTSSPAGAGSKGAPRGNIT